MVPPYKRRYIRIIEERMYYHNKKGVSCFMAVIQMDLRGLKWVVADNVVIVDPKFLKVYLELEQSLQCLA